MRETEDRSRNHGYLKRYPALNEARAKATQPTRVSKTIPSLNKKQQTRPQTEDTTHLGIENDTQQRGKDIDCLSGKHRYRKRYPAKRGTFSISNEREHPTIGIENDTQQRESGFDITRETSPPQLQQRTFRTIKERTHSAIGIENDTQQREDFASPENAPSTIGIENDTQQRGTFRISRGHSAPSKNAHIPP